jgi:AraC-like DNA-binding protein
MFYQALMINNSPHVNIVDLTYNPSHWHREIEILYCIKGSFEVIIDGCNYYVQTGTAVFIGSAESHECVNVAPGTKILLLEMNELFLKKNFECFLNRTFTQPVIADIPGRIQCLFDTIISEYNKPEIPDSELAVMGCLFNLALFMSRELPSKPEISHQKTERFRAIQCVGQVFEHINKNYDKEITVREAAKLTEYGKTYFIRLFKQATQMTFHQYLNVFRINKACAMLTYTDESIEVIAKKTGFPQTRTFWRVFKSIMKKTPREYRRSVFHDK